MFYKMRRKRSFVVALSTMSSLLILLIAYQNCGGPLTTLSSSGSTSESLCNGDGECSSVVGDGEETPQPPDGNGGGGNGPDPIDPDPSPTPEEPPPQISSDNQWIQVAKRTKAQVIVDTPMETTPFIRKL